MSEEAIDSILEYSEDISDAEPAPPLPASNYPATVVGAEKAVSGVGNKYALISLRVHADDFPADFEPEEGEDGITLQYRRPSLENTRNGRHSLRRFMEAVGAPMSTRMDMADWIGLTCNITTTVDVWEGIPRANVKTVTADV